VIIVYCCMFQMEKILYRLQIIHLLHSTDVRLVMITIVDTFKSIYLLYSFIPIDNNLGDSVDKLQQTIPMLQQRFENAREKRKLLKQDSRFYLQSMASGAPLDQEIIAALLFYDDIGGRSFLQQQVSVFVCCCCCCFLN
jgi:hypothetical protein